MFEGDDSEFEAQSGKASKMSIASDIDREKNSRESFTRNPFSVSIS